MEPKTLEEQVVHDADDIDKCGYLGLIRGVAVFTEFGITTDPRLRDLYTIVSKLAQASEFKFYTPTGKKLAEKLISFNRKIFLKKKVKGELETYCQLYSQVSNYID